MATMSTSVIYTVVVASLGLILSGCDGGDKQKLCCFQCGGGGAEEMHLQCQKASYTDEDGNPSCELSDLSLSGSDSSQCERSADPYEHVGGNSSSTITAYGQAAGKFWQDGGKENDRASAWQHAAESPSLHRSWGNNSNLSVKEIVENHKLAVTEKGHLLFVRGVPHHPLSVEVAGFWDFLNNVVSLIETAIQSVTQLCTDAGKAAECLAAVGLVALAEPSHVLRAPTAAETLVMLNSGVLV
jgi:hypothetical protein